MEDAKTIWTVLGLDGPIDDKCAIKKAYAKRLKVTRPDDDLTAFIQLREAYEAALKYAPDTSISFDELERPASRIEFDDDLEPEIYPNSDPEYDYFEIDSSAAADELVSFYPEDDLQQRISRDIQSLLANGDAHLKPQSWKQIIENPDYFSVDAELILERIIREAILVHYGFYAKDGVFGNIGSAKEEASSIFMSEAAARFNGERPTTWFATYLFDKFEWHLPEKVGFDQFYKIEWLRQKLDVVNRSRSDLGHSTETDDPFADDKDGTWLVVLGSLIFTFLIVYFWFGRRF